MRKLTLLAVLATAALALVVPTAAFAASDQSSAKTLLVTTKDLPAGWTATAHDTTGDTAPAEAIATCMDAPTVKKKVTVTSDDISDPSGKFSATNTVAVYATPALAKKQFAAYVSPKYKTCAQKYFETTPFGGTDGPLPSAVQVADVKLKKLGQKRVGYALRADIPQADGTSLSVYSVQAAVLKGRAIVKTQFNGSGDVFSQTDGEAALAAINKRLSKTKF